MADRAGLQEASGIVGYHPWEDAGLRHADWIIEHVSLGGPIEVMCWRRKVILLERDRTVSQRRCDLSHAVGHIDLGHRKSFDRASERAADRLAAKRLIALVPLGAALLWTDGRPTLETAEILSVDLPTLEARLTCLHPAEKGYLGRVLSVKEMVA